MTVLAAHHTADPHLALPTESFLILHDGTATWDLPGSPQYATLHIQRDLADRTYRIDHARHALASLAQNWLIARGADPGRIRPDTTGLGTTDDATRALESQLALCEGRFTVVDSYTYDQILPPSSATADGMEYFFKTWVIVRDTAPEPGHQPIRVYVEDINVPAETYTLRAGGFADVADAQAWTETIGTPDSSLPPLTAPTAHRTSAARTGSPAYTAAGPRAPADASLPAPARSARGTPTPGSPAR